MGGDAIVFFFQQPRPRVGICTFSHSHICTFPKY